MLSEAHWVAANPEMYSVRIALPDFSCHRSFGQEENWQGANQELASLSLSVQNLIGTDQSMRQTECRAASSGSMEHIFSSISSSSPNCHTIEK